MSWWLGGPVPADGALHFGAPTALLAVAAGLAVLSLVLMLAAVRSGRARWVELAFFAPAALLLALAVADPRLSSESGVEDAGRIVVLVDGSASMAVEEGGEPRAKAVDAQLAALSSLGPLEVYTFDEDLQPGAPAAYAGHASDLGVALSAVADRYLGEPLRGVVVLTDGIDRGALRRAVSEAAAEGRLSPALVPALPGPLSLLAVGTPRGLRDLAIEEVVSGGFAFLRTPVSLRARIRGAPGEAVPVSLAEGGRLVEEQSVTLGEDGRGEAVFTLVPREVGRFAWELSVPLSDDDAVPGNNTHPVVLRVVRDRTRVLQVSGSPSTDQKFLRLLLKEDQSIDLVSFFILRSPGDVRAGWRGSELSLIEFPYERLFTDDLSSFDLVILQNFNYGPYFDSFAAEGLLQNIAEYVEKGGGLIMVGGSLSFDMGEYAGTPIARVLPVRLGLEGAKADETRFRPHLSAAGKAHPMTRLAGNPDETEAIWSGLPELDGLNLSLGPTEGAAVLLEHPLLKAGGAPMPVLTVAEVGEGRSAALMVDASWRWAFSEVAQGRGNQAYLRFWKGAMRWLVADPEDRRVVVVPSRENALVGEELRLTIRVRDASYGPQAEARVEGRVVAPSGAELPIDLLTNAAGEATLTLRPTEQGAHRVEVRGGPLAAERAETVFAVSARDPELSEITPDHAYLRTLAAIYGDRGRFVEDGSVGDVLLDEGAVRRSPQRAELRLAKAPGLGLAFGLLFGLGLLLRRRLGAA
jgi:uncharacterized membrane protein